MDLSVSPKDEICFLRMCHHISNAVYRTSLSRRKQEPVFGLDGPRSLKSLVFTSLLELLS
jgi:hypothetical protein